MIVPTTFDPAQAFITLQGRIFQVLKADGSWDEGRTVAAYKAWIYASGSVVEAPDLVQATAAITNTVRGTVIESADIPSGKATVSILGILPVR